jgi:hypothetical protein
MKKLIAIVFAGAFLTPFSRAQVNQHSDTSGSNVRVAANTQYNKAGKFKRIMFGEHYRKEWTTPVDIQILDLSSFAGGLTPIKMGGGLQTKSLRLQGADGKEYVLRSVNKDPSKAIAPELRGTFAEDVVQDQISSANPYAPMVVASIEEAAGIFHSTPRMVYVEKSDRLGEFKKIFGETICLLEERPSDDEEGNPAFGNSKDIVNSEKLFQKIFSNSDHVVDEKAFLKARLFDMLIGDWDRHEDQWLWASFKEGNKTIYKPIPRDRDQAFSKMDGLIPHLATQKWAIRKVQDFDYTIHDIVGLNVNGGHLDRNFTTRLTLNDWKEVAKELQTVLTNDVITKAFREMPEPIYNVSGKTLTSKLERRRDDLIKYATGYYNFLSQQVTITGTKDREVFEVERLSNDSTKITVYEKNKNGSDNTEIFNRVFVRSETKEVRLYGLEGKDVFNIRGDVEKGITIRVIGGKGQDSVTDGSIVREAGKQTKVYDDKDNVFNTDKESRLHLSTDTLKNGYNRKSFTLDWLAPMQAPGYNVDDGFFIGVGVVYRKQQFGKSPYGYMQALAGNYAFATGAYSVWYKGTFREFIGKSDLHLSARYNSPTYTINYYGMGNETVNDENAAKDYYHVRMSRFELSSSLSRQLGKAHTISIGGAFQSVKLGDNEGRFVESDDKLDSTDYDRKNYGSVQVSYSFNTTDNALYPRKGVRINTGAAYIQNIDETEKRFVRLTSEALIYASVGRLTFASRTGVATNLGDEYEFFQANGLGGLSNLRGFHRDRFAGKTSAYQNTELRFKVSNVNAYVAKGSWGLLSFVDHGKVWIPGETSDTWHYSYGGGVWFLPFNKMAFTATYAVSKEDQLVSIKTGFLF